MAVSEVHHTNQSDKSRDNSKAKEKKERPLTKVVVRRLPPSMDQETFLVQVSPLPDYDYLYLVKGDRSLGENAYARAYINFIDASDVYSFKEKFDNYVFVDQKGHEYPAVVEFATFQKIPRKRKPRLDPKCATVDSDLYYIEFLESLKEQPTLEQKPEYSYQFNTESKEEMLSTPLLDFIKQRCIDKLRIREERREQRKQREQERKKLREEEHRKRQEQRFSSKSVRSAKNLDALNEHPVETAVKAVDDETESVTEKTGTPFKDKRYPYSNTKPKFFSHAEKADYFEKKSEFKKHNRKEDNRDKEFRNRRFDDYKKETPRKTKKYSEKREERKNEVKKKCEDAGQDSKEVTEEKKENCNSVKQEETDSKHVLEYQSSIEDDFKDGMRDDPRVQRRIRNKDRPTMAIYQPGMLSKKKVDGPEGEISGTSEKE